MLWLLSLLTPQQWLGVAVLALLAIWQFWPALSGAVSAARARLSPAVGGNTLAPTVLDEVSLDVAAFRRLKRRVKTPEGRAALKVVWQNLDSEDEASA